MSQEKVDAYKLEKKGRKARLAKQKRNRKIAKGVCLLVLVAIVGLASWRVYTSKHPAEVASTEIADEATPTADIVDESAGTAETTDESTDTTEAADESTDATSEEAAETETAEDAAN